MFREPLHVGELSSFLLKNLKRRKLILWYIPNKSLLNEQMEMYIIIPRIYIVCQSFQKSFL